MAQLNAINLWQPMLRKKCSGNPNHNSRQKNQRAAEARLVKFQQTVEVTVLFSAHLTEFGGLFRIILLQSVGKILVDARVFFFKRNGDCEDFLFCEAVERLHKNPVAAGVSRLISFKLERTGCYQITNMGKINAQSHLAICREPSARPLRSGSLRAHQAFSFL